MLKFIKFIGEKLQKALVWLCDLSHESYFLAILTFLPIICMIIFNSIYYLVYVAIGMICEALTKLRGDKNESEENH